MVQSSPYSALMPLAPWEAPAIVAEALESLRLQSLPPKQVVVSCDGKLPAPLLLPRGLWLAFRGAVRSRL